MSTTISIILPFYNSAETLNETLESLYEETTRATDLTWNLIAIDDGSTDDSVAIVKSWNSKLQLTLKELPHSGTPAIARNLGIDLCDSDFMFFLDADDLVLPNGLSTAVRFAVENKSDVVLPRLKSLGGRGVPRGMYKKSEPSVEFLKSRVYWAMNPMKVLRTEFVKANGIKFDTTLRKDSDQPFSLRAYLAADVISVLANPPAIGYRYTKSASNLTLRPYFVDFCFDYLAVMMKILDESEIDREELFPLLIRNWEIEISRELIWKRLAILPLEQWNPTFSWLHEFSQERLRASMLPNTSIRWRGIVGIIGTANLKDFERLLEGRKLVLENRSWISKSRGIFVSNWIRLKSTVFLPKHF
jgi:glycosyltransferase involved in cell wall biosynthesis